MSGLDKIVEEIKRQAMEEASNILNEADAYCYEYMKKIKFQVAEEVDGFYKKTANERKLYEEKTISGVAFSRRNAILKAKQELINQVLQKAKEKMEKLSDDEYFNCLEQILRNNIQKGEGKICFSKKDLERMPGDFSNRINKIIKERCMDTETSIVIEKEPMDIKNGFVLIYGEVEQNCTFDTLFAYKMDRLKDIANRKMFMEENEGFVSRMTLEMDMTRNGKEVESNC